MGSKHFSVAPDIKISIIDGEAALLNVRTGAYFGLNAVGTLIWQSFAEGKTFDQTVQRITKEFAAEVSVATADARKFTEKMLALGLLRSP